MEDSRPHAHTLYTYALLCGALGPHLRLWKGGQAAVKPVYQCCYTNATQNTGNKAASGWQVTAASPDIPADAYDACVRLQNANAALCANAVDEQGNVLVLDEYVGDGSYLYVIRTQFGLQDRLGRANMFSHALIFTLRGNGGLLRDPNYFLSLHPSAFRSGEGTFSWEGTPIYRRSLTLGDAMVLAGLDRERYALLIRCVYAQMDAKGAPPLYIQYDVPARIRGLLYCIYAGLPHSMAKTLRAAACPTANDGGKHLVFSRNAHAKDRFLLPHSGENTVLTPRMERRLSRYGFVDHAALHLPLEQFPDYFDRLDMLAENFGDCSASNSQVLKLAYQFMSNPHESTFTDAQLEGCLTDALRLPPGGSATVEWLLTRMLREFSRRGLCLTAEGRALLDGWLRQTSSQALAEAGRGVRTAADPSAG